ncbi:hypothetical protein [Flavicella sp.]|uniref:hypothetical protein n=1 Tax=Flavicella sp. TaxID=2957742 RepID=UPI003015C771
MKSASDVIFEHQIEVIAAYKRHLKEFKIQLPVKRSEKRDLFIRWYLIEFDECQLDVIMSDLSNHILFLSEKTIENLIYKNAKR